jgi:hypothetical protein
MRAALDGDFLLNKSTRLVSILRAVGDKLKSSAGQCDTPETLHALLLESRDCAKLIQRAGLVCDVDLSRAAVRCVHCADPAAFEAIDDYDTLLPAFHAAGRRDVRLAILHGMVHGSVERASVFARDELKGEERLAAAVLLLNHRDYSLNHEIDRALSRAAPLPVAMRKNVHVHLPSTAHYVAITRRPFLDVKKCYPPASLHPEREVAEWPQWLELYPAHPAADDAAYRLAAAHHARYEELLALDALAMSFRVGDGDARTLARWLLASMMVDPHSVALQELGRACAADPEKEIAGAKTAGARLAALGFAVLFVAECLARRDYATAQDTVSTVRRCIERDDVFAWENVPNVLEDTLSILSNERTTADGKLELLQSLWRLDVPKLDEGDEVDGTVAKLLMLRCREQSMAAWELRLYGPDLPVRERRRLASLALAGLNLSEVGVEDSYLLAEAER